MSTITTYEESNNFLDSFAHIFDIHHESVQAFFKPLQLYQAEPRLRSLEIQEQYTIQWCQLAQFLYDHRHLKLVTVNQPLEFIVHFDQSYSTDCYWWKVFSEVWILNGKLLEELIPLLNFKDLAHPLNHVKPLRLFQYIESCLVVMKLIRFIQSIIQTHQKSILAMFPHIVQLLHVKFLWLSIISCWLTTFMPKQKPLYLINLYQVCVLLIRDNSELFSQDPVTLKDLQSIARYCRVHAFYRAGKYYIKDDIQPPHALYCWKQAKAEGLIEFIPTEANAEIDQLIQDFSETTTTTTTDQFTSTTIPELIYIDSKGLKKPPALERLVSPNLLQGLCVAIDLKKYPLNLPLHPCLIGKKYEFIPTPAPSEDEEETIAVIISTEIHKEEEEEEQKEETY